ICFDVGASGVSEKLDFIQESLHYEPEFTQKEILDLEVYFEKPPLENWMERIHSVDPKIKIELTKEENQDWMQEWKKHFKSFALVDKYWVVPSWEKFDDPDSTAIWIDPGLAFGTGTHATTQICSELIFGLIGKKLEVK